MYVFAVSSCNRTTDRFGTWPLTYVGDTREIDCPVHYEGNTHNYGDVLTKKKMHHVQIHLS